jgi:hypothetical protein
MSVLIQRKAQTIFVSASSVKVKGKNHKIVIESRPTSAIVKLQGSRECFPIAWEVIYQAATQLHEQNLRLEAEAERSHKPQQGNATG